MPEKSSPPSQANVKLAAEQLYKAQKSGRAVEPIRKLFAEKDLAAAYAVQNELTERALRDGRRLVGRKIGLTSKSVQKQIGIDEPDYGMLFSDLVLYDGDTIEVGRLIAPRVEAEVAFVLERPLNKADTSIADVLRSTAYAIPAIEVVDSRIKGWDIGIVDTIADNASSGMYVLGNQSMSIDSMDLRLVGMVTEKNGEAISFGAGAACLGHPLHAVAWLARKMVDVGRPLDAGDTVLSGALGPMVDAAAGDCFETRISGLGSVRIAFEKQ